MTASQPLPRVPRASLPASLLHALLIAALGGACLGALDALRVLLGEGVRYAQWGAGVALVGVVSTAGLGALLSVPAALLALALHGRPAQRTASPGVCAGVGTLFGLGAFVLTDSFSMVQLLPLVCGGTLLCLALRELLGYWGLLGRAGTWWALATLTTAASGIQIALTTGSGGSALALAGGSLVCVLGARLLVPRLGHLPVTLGGSLLAAGALVVLTRAPYPGPTEPGSTSTGPNVLHISIDTLRADRVGSYGYERAHTPTIDRLAREGVLFEGTTSQANTTGPAHTTQLTGLYPAEHGALYNGRPLHHTVHTLPEQLSTAGWDTAGFVSGFTMVDSACGLAPRFDWYDDAQLSWRWMPQACEQLAVVHRVLFRLAARRGEWITRADRPAVETIDSALAWLANRPRPDAPFYAFVHLYDPHAPYVSHDTSDDARGYDWYALSTPERELLVADPERVARMNALYDGEVRYADEQVGRLIEALEALAELDDTLVILTSDHGEGFGAHDYWFDHGTFVFDEELQVPLILRLPAGAHAGTRVVGQTRLLDLTPTVLELLGLAPDGALSGTSLLPLVEGDTPASGRPSFAVGDQRLSLRTDQYKLIWTAALWTDTQRSEERYELFDLTRDPAEQHDLLAAGPAPAEFEALRAQLDAWREATEDTGGDEPLDPEVAAQLRKLGYL